jgi:hypothetical protein
MCIRPQSVADGPHGVLTINGFVLKSSGDLNLAHSQQAFFKLCLVFQFAGTPVHHMFVKFSMRYRSEFEGVVDDEVASCAAGCHHSWQRFKEDVFMCCAAKLVGNIFAFLKKFTGQI